MAYRDSGNVVIDDSRNFSFSNVTIQNNGFLEITSSDGFQGTVAGYAAGGLLSPTAGNTTYIQKYPYAADSNSTLGGNLFRASRAQAGMSSDTHGYVTGGYPASQAAIDKFSFANDGNAVEIGSLIQAARISHGTSSSTHGYTSGGGSNVTPVNTIEKFPFSVDSNGTDVGDLNLAVHSSSSQSSATHGYMAAGSQSTSTGPIVNDIQRWPFSTDSNATDVGDLIQARVNPAGQSSTTHGYASGGRIPAPNTPPFVNPIDKFPFATNTNATDVGDMTEGKYFLTGSSSTVSGYNAGGFVSSPLNTIEKFPFATDTNATDVGDLTMTNANTNGHQD